MSVILAGLETWEAIVIDEEVRRVADTEGVDAQPTLRESEQFAGT